jgi:plastocyanin
MEPTPTAKPAEAPKPKNRTMIYAIIIVAILIVVGIGVYIITLKPSTTATGTPVTIWDNSSGCTSSATCGYHNSTNGSVLKITSGTMVTWTNSGSAPHTVTACVSSNPSFSSAVSYGSCPSGGNASGLQNFDSGSSGIAHGSSWSFTFNTAGNYSYYCSIHPWMHGIVIVS